MLPTVPPNSKPSEVTPVPPIGSRPRGICRHLRARRARIVEGLLLGALVGLCFDRLGIAGLMRVPFLQDTVAVPCLAGIALALSPARRLLRMAACGLIAALALIGYTPLTKALVPTLVRSDALAHAPAIVVLSTSAHKDGTLDSSGQERSVQAYLLLRQHYAGSLVLTRSVRIIGDQTPAVQAQMRVLGLDFPVETVGPVANTHDEAVAVAELARARGWKRVILVTHPWHMRRARALFLKCGLDVICSPCVEGSYDIRDLSAPGGRIKAFRDWLHETVGFEIYRLRGWL